MKKLSNIYVYILINVALIMILTISCKKQDESPSAPPDITVVVIDDSTTTDSTIVSGNDTMVKFTLYSKRVPYIWKRVVNTKWIQDTIKTNNAVRYEPYDKRNMGIGYWVTMNLAGVPSDSLHIIGEYKGKVTQMASLYHQSAAYVLLDNVKP